MQRREHAGAGVVSIPLRLLIAARAPRSADAHCRPIGADTKAAFGPFAVGDVVRVHSTARAWVLFGAAEAPAVGHGVPQEAWTTQQYEISAPTQGYVWVIGDAQTADAYALAWVIGHLEE